MSALQAAIQSFLTKSLRGIVATLITVALTAIPFVQDLLVAAGLEASMAEKAVYGVLVSLLAALLSFLQKLNAPVQPPAPPVNAK